MHARTRTRTHVKLLTHILFWSVETYVPIYAHISIILLYDLTLEGTS